MKKRMILAVLSICTALFTGCGAKTVYALEPAETVEETEVMVTESTEATETEEVISMESTEMQEDITDADYIALAKDCEQEFKILDGEEYDCDIAIEIRGCTYIYEFPEKDVNAEECNLWFDYEMAKVDNSMEEKVVEIPVSVFINKNKYLIGTADIFGVKMDQSDGFVNSKIIFYYDDEYRKSIDYDLLKEHADNVGGAIIRDYNEKDRTIELCYVTMIERETSTGYEVEKEEWVKLPLSEDVKIIAWSLSNTSDAYINEELFSERIDTYSDDAYFFANVIEDEGSVKGIIQVFNP